MQVNKKVADEGTAVLYTHTISSEKIEEWVQRVAALACEPETDWHWFGGRAVIKTLGDPYKVLGAAFLLKDEHDALQCEVVHEIAPERFRAHKPTWVICLDIPLLQS